MRFVTLSLIALLKLRGLQAILFGIVLLATTATAALLFSSAVSASPSSRPMLTTAVLEQRIAEPIRAGGVLVVDLSGFTIDLRPGSPDSEAFTEQFYRRLQKGLNGVHNGSPALGLSIDGGLIQGDLELARLSLRVPAYGGVALPALEAFSQKAQLVAPPTRSLTRSLLIQPPALQRSSQLSLQLDTLVFQGPLLMNETCFNGAFKAAGLYFLAPIEAEQAIFTQMADWRGAQFARSVNFSQGQFQQESSFRAGLFASQAKFNQASFNGFSQWQGSSFQSSVSFAQADFHSGSFARSHWLTNADFDQAIFHDAISFQKSRFDQSLFLTDAQFEAAINFRQAQFQGAISLRGAHILSQLDFGDARFAPATALNVADLDFNAGEARILGSPGQIGRVFSVPALASNETVLRNLVRNFRLLEQISDANQIEYTAERLRLAQIRRQIFGVSLNQANVFQLVKLGLSAAQAQAVKASIQTQPFVSRADLLGVSEIDLATYLKVRDRITTQPANVLSRAGQLFHWLLLAGLLRLSNYGTSVGLIFSVGMIATTLFGIMFWLIDRYRRRLPTPLVPNRDETLYILQSGGIGLAVAIALLSSCSDYPAQTLVAVGVIVLPIPAGLIMRLYQQGRYHDLMESSYFVKNGALRKLQILIARLPVIPEFPFYRDRYLTLLIDRRWSWLNYYDFSLNNWFKFGFNDIRLRDQAVPGLISILVWYQWGLGTAYIALLLWTFSRTIPGLNLLLYF